MHAATIGLVDPDGFTVSTIITRGVELSVADELLAGSTYAAESTEPAVPDMILPGSTVFTKSLEPADEEYSHQIFASTGH